jgi:DNA polymerase-3 subunit delta
MPALSSERFLKSVAGGKVVPGILLLGGDIYLRDLCRAKLIEAYVPEAARGWGVWRVSVAQDPIDRALNQAQSLPMLAPRQVVFDEDLESLEALGEEAREEAVKRLGAYLDDPAPFTVLVLEAAALDQRMKLFKMLDEKTVVVALELAAKPEDRVTAAAAMALQMAREMGVELVRDAAEELAEALDGNLAGICNELAKLAAYAGDCRQVTRADVEALVVSARKYSVWQLAEMLGSGQRSRALEFLDSLLREGEQPAGLVGAMAWMYRKLLEAQELPAHLSGWQAARQLGMRPETAELALRQSRKIRRPQLLEGLAALSEADNRLKSGGVMHRAVMEFLVARLTGGARVSAAP